jgi:hypothetical protein
MTKRVFPMTLRVLALLAPRDATKPVKHHGTSDIESNVHPQQPKVSPARVPARMHALQELIRAVHLTIPTF